MKVGLELSKKNVAANGSIVEFVYDERRSSFCVPDDRLKSFKVIQ